MDPEIDPIASECVTITEHLVSGDKVIILPVQVAPWDLVSTPQGIDLIEEELSHNIYTHGKADLIDSMPEWGDEPLTQQDIEAATEVMSQSMASEMQKLIEKHGFAEKIPDKSPDPASPYIEDTESPQKEDLQSSHSPNDVGPRIIAACPVGYRGAIGKGSPSDNLFPSLLPPPAISGV